MKNQVYSGTPTSRRFVKVPTSVKAGDPLLVGVDPAFALNDYSSATGGTVCLFNGTFSTSVTAKSSLSPSTGSTVKPGDALYAEGGSLDSTTNVTTGFTIDKNASGTTPFGHLDESYVNITSTTTDAAAWVKI